MAGGYLDNLINSFGGMHEGPDPGRLEGLGELARQRLAEMDPEPEELLGHVSRMRNRLREMYRDRQGNFESRRSQLSDELAGLIQSNLDHCASLEGSLEAFALAYEQQEKEAAQEALAEYDQSVVNFFQSCDQLAQLARSEEPLCPRCGSVGPEALCPSCQVDRLSPDPNFADEEFEQTQVNEEFAAVFQAYSAILEGRGTLEQLSQALQPLEFTLLEAQALVEQSLDEHPEEAALQELLDSINSGLEGVQRMHGVEQNRSTRELNQGWSQVFRSAAILSRALPALGAEIEDDENYEEEEEDEEDDDVNNDG